MSSLVGGDVIIVSECSEGFGSEEYREANANLVELGSDAWLDSILPKKREIFPRDIYLIGSRWNSQDLAFFCAFVVQNNANCSTQCNQTLRSMSGKQKCSFGPTAPRTGTCARFLLHL